MFKFSIVSSIALFAASIAAAQAPDLERMDIVMKSVPAGPVAKVRGVNIGRDEFVKFYTAELALLARRTGGQITMEDRVQLGLSCLRILVQHELLYQEAQSKGMRPSDAEVRKAWERERETLRDRIRRTSGVEASDEEVLQRAGYRSEAEVLKEVRRSLMIERMSRKILDDANYEVDESQVKSLYEKQQQGFGQPAQLHLQQVFISAERGKGPRARKAREDARMKAEEALQRLQTGQRFGAVVRQMSDGRNSETGGHMGPLPKDQFPPFMVEAVQALEPGQYTGVLESDFGYHIVRLVELVPGADADAGAAKKVIREYLRDKEGERIIGEHCEGLVKSPSELQIYLELEENLARISGETD